VYFDPVVAGNFAAAMQVLSNDVDEGTLDIPLSGIGVFPDPTIVVTPPSLNYPDTHLGLVRDLTITIENVGFAPLSVTDITSDALPFQVTEVLLPAVLGTFQTLDVQIIFEPDAESPFGGTISIDSNDPDDPTVLVSASGDGVIRTYDPGAVVWSAQGIENVVSVQVIPDVTGNGILDALMETYDAGADGDPHVALYGNSDGGGVRIWSVGEGMSGGWGDLCLDVSDDLDGDGHSEVLRGVAWGGRRAEVRDAHDGGLVWQFDTDPYDGGGWVYSVRSMPDVSGDDLPEVLAATGTDGPGSGARRLFCLDGADGSVRWAQFSPDAFLSCAWIEDVNNDGVTDALGGSGGNSNDDRVYCVSGASSGNGTVIWDFATGGTVWSVNVIDDVTGDSIDDVIAGSTSNTVFCIDGAAGTEVWSTPVGSDVIRVEAIDDITGDGEQDVITAQIGSTFRALDGVTGDQHWVFPTGGNVWSTYPMPDVNDDSVPDVVAGSQDDKVYCVSGADGSELWSTNVGALVYTVRPTIDVNGNGYPDVLAGTQFLGGSGGKMWCLEGGAIQVSAGDPSVVPGAGVWFVGLAPNPMPGAGVFTFETGTRAGEAIVVDIFDLAGRRIRRLQATAEGGRQRIGWDGRDGSGGELGSGVYFYRIGMPGPEGSRRVTETGRVTLLR
jgi:outer membrane protein assembly factor BamB